MQPAYWDFFINNNNNDKQWTKKKNVQKQIY